MARRIGHAGLLLVALTVFSFSLGKMAPGDPARALLRMQLAQPPTDQQVTRFSERLGLDDPAVVQLGRWVVDAAQGDLGQSFRSGRPVATSLWEAFPITLDLSLLAFVIAVGLAVPLGVLAAIRSGGLLDHATRVLALGGASLPNFWLGYLLIIAFAVKLHLLPTQGATSALSYVLPAVTLAVYPLGVLLRLTRASMLEVLGDDFVLAARSRGLPRRMFVRHAARVALNPVLTYAGILIGGLLGGAVIVETVFSMPGMGKLVVDAISDRDFPIVQGFVLYFGILVLLVNLVVDLLYVVLDPRVRLVEAEGMRADAES